MTFAIYIGHVSPTDKKLKVVSNLSISHTQNSHKETFILNKDGENYLFLLSKLLQCV